MQIYLARNNVQAGPYTLEQLNTMLMSGEVVLDDLMWHEGMAKWQRLGDMTANQYRYQPSVNTQPIQTPPATNNQSTTTTSTTDNAGTNSNNRRVSVEQLYARPTDKEASDSSSNRPANNDAANNDTANNRNSNLSLTKTSASTAKTLSNTQGQSVTLAPLMSRVLALAINGVLYLLSVLPIGLALAQMDIDLDKFRNVADFDVAYQYSLSLVESIPSSTLMMSQLMMFGLFAIQLLLIIRRGQSLGKMMTGIRVVDQTSYRLPPLGRLLGMRTLLLLLIYNILFSVANILGFVAIIINYFMASKSAENIGWHDKIAKTLVVKAENNQLNKDPLK